MPTDFMKSQIHFIHLMPEPFIPLLLKPWWEMMTHFLPLRAAFCSSLSTGYLMRPGSRATVCIKLKSGITLMVAAGWTQTH